MFRNSMRKVAYHPNAPIFVDVEEKVKDERGFVNSLVVKKEVNTTNFKPLPPPETFSIEAYQNSGIPLKQVNTKIIPVGDDVIDEVLTNTLDAIDAQENKPTE